MAKKKQPLNFEQSLARLEEIVAALEEGGLSLQESVNLFEEGQRLSQLCEGELDAAERKIEALIRRPRGGGSESAVEETRVEIGPDDDIDEALDAARPSRKEE